MFRKLSLAGLCAAAICVTPGLAAAQVAPQPVPDGPGDVIGSTASYIINGLGVLDFGTPAAIHYQSSNPTIELPAVSYDEILRRGPASDYANFAYISTSTNYAGVVMNATYAHSQPIGVFPAWTYAQTLFTVTVPCLRTGAYTGAVSQFAFTAPDAAGVNYSPSPDGTQYGVGFLSTDPRAAYQAYVSYVRSNTGTADVYAGNQHPTGQQFRNGVYSCSAAGPSNPLAGNANSLQFGLIEQGLSITTLGDPDFDEPTSLVGVQYGQSSLNGAWGQRFDAIYQRNFRIIPGSRTQLTLSLPFSVYDSGGHQQYRGSAGLGLQIPMTRDWTLEPKASYGFVTASADGISGQAAALSLASQYALYGLGRGRLTIGNLVGVTEVTHAHLLGAPLNHQPIDFVTRDGLAYEMPLKMQVDGRAASLRAAYTYTYVSGSQIYLSQSHDVTMSMGVRSRENTLHNSFEMLRLGLRGQFGKQYDAAFIYAGYTF